VKYALSTSSTGEKRIVEASGKALGDRDVDRPILHVLPKLMVLKNVLAKDHLDLIADSEAAIDHKTSNLRFESTSVI
jgi:hypothetical protein